ncbi:hypothetical protein B0H17DRAFT_1218859 [Mycena rosella]|uniref:DUF6533 domain-containing protein n=1 Tax=Mycena rosella TaxID=1033263 RepID=A0AAD7FL17_MYCRO|nr:hypothetical protein B0H17DRAFT_1218859 [Mycena rosella]
MSDSRLQALLDSTDLDYATFTSDYRIYRYAFLAGLVIVIYDHLLTFSTEVKYIWLTKLRPSTCWFLAVRYIGLIGNTIVLNQVQFYVLSKRCIRMLTVWEIFIISQEVLIETTLSIRVFAMYGRNIWVLVPLLALVCISGTLAVVGAVKLDGPAQNLAAPGLNGCNTPYPRSTADHVAKAWMVMLACDMLVFALTVRQAYMQRHTSRLYAGSLIQKMLKDGLEHVFWGDRPVHYSEYLDILSWRRASLRLLFAFDSSDR